MSSLVAYDASLRVIATLDQLVVVTPDGPRLVDFEAHEEAGREHTDLWNVAGAAGSKVWPEHLGVRAHEFRVELDESKRIRALVHRSGHRRERTDVDDRGSPIKPLRLDEQGRTRA